MIILSNIDFIVNTNEAFSFFLIKTVCFFVFYTVWFIFDKFQIFLKNHTKPHNCHSFFVTFIIHIKQNSIKIKSFYVLRSLKSNIFQHKTKKNKKYFCKNYWQLRNNVVECIQKNRESISVIVVLCYSYKNKHCFL